MLARKLALVVVLVVATPAFADFRSDLSMTATDDGAPLAYGGTVGEGSVIAVTITDAQTWNHPTPDPMPPTGRNHMTWIQINFDASTAALLPTLADATTSWAWLSGIGGGLTTEVDDWLREYIVGPPPTPPVVLSTLDYLLKRTGAGGWPVYMSDVPVFDLGRLTFTAPAYNPGGNNTYTVDISGGVYDDTPGHQVDTITQLIGSGAGESAGLAWQNGGPTMTVENFTFNVAPEPATLALLALGGVAMLFRRKR